VTERQLTVMANSAMKVYDGTPLSNGTYTILNGSLADDDYLVVTMNAIRTNVGISVNIIDEYTIYNGADEDVTSNYDIVTRNGLLVVIPRLITITAASDEKEFDNTPLENDGYSITRGTLAPDQLIADITVTGSQTDVGSSPNVASGAVIEDEDGNNVTSNYIIRYRTGTLEVTPNTTPITIIANSNSKVYDGMPLTDDGFSVDPDDLLPDGVNAAATISGIQTDVGTSDNDVIDFVIWRGTEDITSYYANITTESGILEVTYRAITITANSASKVYDNNPLTDGGWSITAGTLAPDQTISAITITGSQTPVGSSANVPSDVTVWSTISDNDVTSNYIITYVDGTLTVTQPPAPPEPPIVEPDPDPDPDPNPPTPTPTPNPPAPGPGNNGGNNGGNTGGNTGAGGTGQGGTANAAGAAVNPPAANAGPGITTNIGNQDTPAAGGDTTIPEGDTPTSAGNGNGDSWALINLIMMILSVLVLAFAAWAWNISRRKEEDKAVLRNGIFSVVSALGAIAAVILFFLTEDMTLPMILTDKFTLWQACLFVAVTVISYMAYHLANRAGNEKAKAE